MLFSFIICKKSAAASFFYAEDFGEANVYGPGCHRVITFDMNSMSAILSKESVKWALTRLMKMNNGVVLIYNL